jgi:hypothetical protein
MRKNNTKIKEQIKYERVYEYEDCIQIWKYDNYKSVSNPYEVETKYKKLEKKG